MRTFPSHLRLPNVAVGLLALVLMVGCAPRGDSGGRIDPYRSTPADARSHQASIPALLEFSDQVTAQLARDLTTIDAIQQLPTKAVLELGTIDNKTRTPTADFELIRNRIRGQVFDSQLLRSKFLIVENRTRMGAEMERVTGAGQLVAQYDPNLTYVLQGDFYEAVRDTRRQYYFEFKLTNLVSREIVFLSRYDLGQAQSR